MALRACGNPAIKRGALDNAVALLAAERAATEIARRDERRKADAARFLVSFAGGAGEMTGVRGKNDSHAAPALSAARFKAPYLKGGPTYFERKLMAQVSTMVGLRKEQDALRDAARKSMATVTDEDALVVSSDNVVSDLDLEPASKDGLSPPHPTPSPAEPPPTDSSAAKRYRARVSSGAKRPRGGPKRPLPAAPPAGATPSAPSPPPLPAGPPASAAEVDFDVSDPPLLPVEPPGVAPALEDDKPLSANDVVCGRGPGMNRLEGNKRFRSVVRDFQPTYLAARRTEKPKLARALVLIVRRRGGRFLRRSDEDGRLYELGDVRAEAKAGQALREGLDVRATLRAADLMPAKGKRAKDRRGAPAAAAARTEPAGGNPVASLAPSFDGQGRQIFPTAEPGWPLAPLPLGSGRANAAPGPLAPGQDTEQMKRFVAALTEGERVPKKPRTVLARPPPVVLAAAGDPSPTPANLRSRPPPACKRCNHSQCTKYKQSGCLGYCLTHVKIYHPELFDGGGVLGGTRRRPKSKPKPAPPVIHERTSFVVLNKSGQ